MGNPTFINKDGKIVYEEPSESNTEFTSRPKRVKTATSFFSLEAEGMITVLFFYNLVFIFFVLRLALLVEAQPDEDDDDDDDDYDYDDGNISDIKESSSTTRSGKVYSNKEQFDRATASMLEKVKAITSKQSSAGHTHTQEVLSSSKKRFMVFEQNPQSGKMKKVRAVAEDSQSYDIFTNVFNDGKAVEFDTQDF